MNNRAMGSGCGFGCFGMIVGIVLILGIIFVGSDLLSGSGLSTGSFRETSQGTFGNNDNEVNEDGNNEGYVSNFSSQENQNNAVEDLGTENNGNVNEPVSQEVNTVEVKVYSNCDEMRVDYPNGVYKGDPVYEANPSKDRDGDGRACEPDGE